jgi:hypothetical protein
MVVVVAAGSGCSVVHGRYTWPAGVGNGERVVLADTWEYRGAAARFRVSPAEAQRLVYEERANWAEASWAEPVGLVKEGYLFGSRGTRWSLDGYFVDGETGAVERRDDRRLIVFTWVGCFLRER